MIVQRQCCTRQIYIYTVNRLIESAAGEREKKLSLENNNNNKIATKHRLKQQQRAINAKSEFHTIQTTQRMKA